MLAIIKLPQTVGVIGCLTLCLATQALFGQQPQPPSKNFDPVRSAPPSVHVPAQNVRPIGNTQSNLREAESSHFRDSAVRPTSYTFSDNEIKVPKILTDGNTLPTDNIVNSMKNHMKQLEQNKTNPGSLLAPVRTQPSNQFTNSNRPVVNQANFRAVNPTNASAMPPSAPEDFRNQPFSGGQFKAPQLPARDMSHQPLANNQVNRTLPTKNLNGLNNTQEFANRPAAIESSSKIPATNRLPSLPSPDVYGPAKRTETNAGSFVATQVNAPQTQTQDTDLQKVAAEPIQRPIGTTEPSVQQVPALTQDLPGQVETSNPPRLANYTSDSTPLNNIRTVSNESSTIRDEPQMSLRAPAIQVDTYGPRTIGVNKTGTYKVVVTNQSNFAAESLDVGVMLPSWIAIRNVNLTAGNRVAEEADGFNKLIWSVKSIPANSSHTMTIDAVPTKAQMFDVGIEWAMVPRVASTNVDVTEPRLAMKISGPNDVQYGEKAVYQVTVLNPGTGTAENVVVKLPQALGGEQAKLHDILPGQEKDFTVELLARTAGELNLNTSASADGGLETAAGRKIIVHRAELAIQIQGPAEKYSGTSGHYIVTVLNTGDAPAQNVVAAIALPAGVKYLGGIESVENEATRVRWKIGTLDQGDQRTYKIKCELNADGQLRFDAGVRGDGELAAAHAVETNVQTVADLVLTVADPKGPLPVGEELEYTIRINNRGTRAARAVNLVMQFSKGIEPSKVDGLEHQIMTGQVMFSPIEQIAPGQEVEFTVTAVASLAGTHVFRAQLICDESDSREVAEGTTKFFGESIAPTASSSNGFQPTDENQFKR